MKTDGNPEDRGLARSESSGVLASQYEKVDIGEGEESIRAVIKTLQGRRVISLSSSLGLQTPLG